MQLTANYTLQEFQNVSNRPLTAAQVERARTIAATILQPLRREMGFPITITSFVREGDSGAHGLDGPDADTIADGNAVDFQPCRVCGGVTLSAAEFDARMERMFQWLARYAPSSFGKLIHERNHLHATLPNVQGVVGQVLREPTEGKYILASILPAVVSFGPALILLFVLYLMTRGNV